MNSNVHSDSDDNFTGRYTQQSNEDYNDDDITTEFVTLEYNDIDNNNSDNDDDVEAYIEIQPNKNEVDSGNESDDESSDLSDNDDEIIVNNNNRRTVLLKLSPFIITSIFVTAMLFKRN